MRSHRRRDRVVYMRDDGGEDTVEVAENPVGVSFVQARKGGARVTTSKMAGWKTVLLFGVVAAVSIGVLLIVVSVGTLLWANSVAEELGEPTPVPTAVTIAVAGEAAAPAARGSASSDAPPRVEIELLDGKFEIRAGPAGTEIQVDGEYAENYYELIEEHTPADASGGPTTTIRLRPTSNGLVRMMAAFRGNGDPSRQPNRLTVLIPAGRPLALTLDVSRGESRIDLGGLTLTDLNVDLSMGDHRLGFGEPLAETLQQLRISGDTGNIELDQLGNARARALRISSRMGNFTIDLGGEWPTDDVSDLEITHAMGDLRLRIPNSVRVTPDSRSSATMGESGRIDRREETVDPDAPVLRLDLSTTMGATRITRYVADRPEELATRVPSPRAPEPTR